MAVSLAGAAAWAVVAACHRAPEERVTPLDATPAPSAGAADAAVADASVAEGGSYVTAPSTRAFCDGAYSADDDRLRTKCAIADLAASQALGRAAANLCVRDLDVVLERGHVTFEQGHADACIQMLRMNTAPLASETDTLFSHAPCDKVLTGHQDAGQPCLFPVECKEGLTCLGYRVAVEGTCKPSGKTKEVCSPQVFGATWNAQAGSLHHSPCGPTDWCDGHQCTPRVGPGKPCTSPDSCATGQSCVLGKCAARGQPSAPCQKPADCIYGLWCEAAADGGTGNCANRKAEGESCLSNDECKGSCSQPAAKPSKPTPGTCVSVCGSG
jgi:hypothetical protein